MNRAERRRQEKAAGKAKPKNAVPAPVYLTGQTVQQICDTVGAKVDTMMEYLEAKEREIREAVTLEAQEKLWRAEDYIAVGNILISLFAIKMTWGFTKANQRFLDNLNAAEKYVERVGIPAAYEQARREMGIELEFDDMDINREFGFGGAAEEREECCPDKTAEEQQEYCLDGTTKERRWYSNDTVHGRDGR